MIMARGRKNTSDVMMFNGKKYKRVYEYYSTKENVKIQQKALRGLDINAIIDKRKEGYFIWIGEAKRKPKK